jgi:predicted alpha/beta-fold hydrolase
MTGPAWHYRAPWWLPGGNVQTLWAALAARRHLGPPPRWQRQRWTTPDGDFIDLDFAQHACPPGAPLLVLFHGLEAPPPVRMRRPLPILPPARVWPWWCPTSVAARVN